MYLVSIQNGIDCSIAVFETQDKALSFVKEKIEQYGEGYDIENEYAYFLNEWKCSYDIRNEGWPSACVDVNSTVILMQVLLLEEEYEV